VRAMFETYRQSRSIRKTIFTMNGARRFNRDGKPWARTSIRRILTNPIYVGTVRYAKRAMRGNRIVKQDREKWIVTENACAPIIEQDLFDDLQTSLKANGRPRAWREASTYLLTGLVRCGLCGGRMIGMTCKGGNGQPHRYYRCVRRVQKGPSVCKGLTCRAGELEEVVVSQIVGFDADALRQELEDYKRHMAAEIAPQAKRREELQAAFDGFRERERRLLELYETSAIDLAAFKERRAQLEQQRLVIAGELAETDVNVPDGSVQDIDAKSLAGKFRELQATFGHLSLHEQQRLLQAMTQEIGVHPDGKLDIDFNVTAGVQSPAIPLEQYVEIQIARQGE